MADDFSNAQLEAFLDEALPVALMSAVEDALRRDEGLKARLTEIIGRRDAGLHTLGGIWRRRRLTCPSREQIGSYLLGVLARDFSDYVRFHLEVVQCRYCNASLEDLKTLDGAADAEPQTIRRARYFQSSRHYLSDD